MTINRNQGVVNMAKGDMDDFLRAYYRRLHTDAMPYDVLARLVDNKKKGLLTKEQESWFDPDKGFIVEDAGSELGYRAKDLPKLDGTDGELTEPELEKLYIRFAKAMAGMKSASADYTANDQEAKDFVKRFVDDIKLFPTPAATPECDASITKLIKKLDPAGKSLDEQETIKNIKQIILDETKKVDKPDEKMFNKTEDIEKLLSKCADKKYNSDASVQSKIQQVARVLDSYLNSWSYTKEGVENTKEKNKNYLGGLSDDLSVIDREDAFSNIDVSKDPGKTNLQKFKDGYAEELLQRLYKNKKIREKFGAKDPKFTEIIDKAEGKIAYQDPNSSEYLTPKSDDVLTPLQQVEKWAKDTYNDSMRKYARLRGDPLLFSAFSKEIFKAVDKKGIKPTDGLEGLLNKVNDIKEEIPNKTVMEHFDWFIETIKDIKKRKPKAVAGAWNNAAQMKCVITEIMLKATGPNASDEDMEKAKTAMEIMTAMKYGMMTSKIMDAMKQTDFTVFSDGKLSWNKNEGIQFVTKAFDKSVKAAFLGAGYAVTFARNKIMMSGMKFKDKNNKKGPLGERMNEERTRLANKRVADQNAVNDVITKANNDIAEKTREIADLNIGNRNVNAGNLANRKTQIDKLDAAINTQQGIMDANKTAYDKYEESKKIVDEYNDLMTGTKITDLQTKQADKKTEIINKRNQILDPNTYIDSLTGLSMGDEEKKELENQLTQELKSLQEEYDNITTDLTEKQDKINPSSAYATTVANARTDMAANQVAHDNYNRAETRYSKYETARNDLNSKVQKFEDATKSIDELTDTIEEQHKIEREWPENNKNKLKELEDFWNFLQTGKAKTWGLSTKRAQAKFDINKEAMLNSFVAQHGMAA